MASASSESVGRAHWLLLLPAITLVMAFCNAERETGSNDALNSAGGAAASASSATDIIISSSSYVQHNPYEAGIPVVEAGLTDGALPARRIVRCGPEQGLNAGVCPLPEPTCASSPWLVYYTNPQCVDAICRYDVFAYECWGYCENGGCVDWGTF